jgi:glycosyltransferase involved in cell wall biosynthesis
VLPVGCNEDIFFPRPHLRSGLLEVLYYSTFLPLHGAEVVVRAAARLKGETGIHFRVVGRGQEYGRVRQLADDQMLENIQFLPPLPKEKLADLIGESDIGIGGHFGDSQKAGRVVPGKIYQLLAMEKPVIAGDTPANRSFLKDRETALLCPRGDPASVAEAILELARTPDLLEKLARNGRRLYEQQASERLITQKLEQVVRSALE